jgi:hypothetical protein
MTKRSRTTVPSRRSKEARALRALPHRVIPNKRRAYADAWMRHEMYHTQLDRLRISQEEDDGESI